MLMLRDTQGIAPTPATLPMGLVPLVGRFTGTNTCAEIAEQASRDLGECVDVRDVVRLATELEQAWFVEGPLYRAERTRVERAFADAEVRPASHAGGAYHGDASQLTAYIERECFGQASGRHRENAVEPRGALLGLVAPHIDPWRGARCYGEAYGTLARALPPDVDTFVLLGTSHAPMSAPFALCRKAFATPLGVLEADKESIDALAAASEFDPYANQFNHKREHSLEFQAVFLKHLIGTRRARIIPILAGLGEAQSSGTSPRQSRSVERFLGAVRDVIDGTRAVVIAGADLAHVGPRFGDPHAFDDGERHALEQTDRESLDHAVRGDAEGFWRHVASDLDARRVCGLAPIYALLRVLTSGAQGRLCHYEQTVDAEEGSIVSHAALGFFG